MIYDIYAEWSENRPRIGEITSRFAKLKYLLTDRDSRDARTEYQNLMTGYRMERPSPLYVPSASVLNAMPPFSFFLQFEFALATPYLSRDDDEFYLHQNPIRKEKVFKVPVIAGGSWKGNMRWTTGRVLETDLSDPEMKIERRVRLVKLFGAENDAERAYFNRLIPDNTSQFERMLQGWVNQNSMRRGRLQFYPTFFFQIGLEVINPHDRRTKAGTMPIYMESVPEGTKGTFSLLYVPFDLLGRAEEQVRAEVGADIEVVSGALRKMMLTYGFSAKKSCGFGLARSDIKGTYDMVQPGRFGKASRSFSSFIGLEESMRPKSEAERTHDK